MTWFLLFDFSFHVIILKHMENLFSKTRLKNMDVVTIFEEKPATPSNWWRRYDWASPEDIQYKNSKIKAWSFSDLYNIRKNIYPDSLSIHKKVLMFYNIKGGSAKTTTSAQLAFLFSLMGYRVLAIDLDHQEDLTCSLGIQYQTVKKTIFDVLINDTDINEAIIKLNDNLHVIGANDELDSIDWELGVQQGRVQAMKKALDPIRDNYDIIIMDSHPMKSILNTSAIYTADMVLVPSICEDKGYRGIVRVLNHVKEILSEKFFDDDLEPEEINDYIKKFLRILPTRYVSQRKMDREYLAAFNADFSGMISPPLRESAIFGKASDLALSIFNLKSTYGSIDSLEDLEERIDVGLMIGLNFKHKPCEDMLTIAKDLLYIMKEELK
jgi:chromosome partitioning protein